MPSTRRSSVNTRSRFRNGSCELKGTRGAQEVGKAPSLCRVNRQRARQTEPTHKCADQKPQQHGLNTRFCKNVRCQEPHRSEPLRELPLTLMSGVRMVDVCIRLSMLCGMLEGAQEGQSRSASSAELANLRNLRNLGSSSRGVSGAAHSHQPVNSD